MFALVADVERYPEFLPWCLALRVVSRLEDGPVEVLIADMVVGYRVFREQFRSLVRIDSERLRINVDHVDGPFRSLTNAWRFEERSEGGSVVDFEIAFELKNLILQATAQAVFEKAFFRMSDAFVERADAVYG